MTEYALAEKCILGDQVGTGYYTIHSRFKRVVNFESAGQLVSLVDESVGAGPLNIHASGFPLAKASSLSITETKLVINECAYELEPHVRFSSVIDGSLKNVTTYFANLKTAHSFLKRNAHSGSRVFLSEDVWRDHVRAGFERIMAEQLHEGACALLNGDYSLGVQRLHGCGNGLTPAGDDFLAGWMIAQHLIKTLGGVANDDWARFNDAVRVLRSDNLLVDSFLRMARAGRVTEREKRLVDMLLCGASRDVESALICVMAHGASSGSDWACGFLRTLQTQSVRERTRNNHEFTRLGIRS